MTKYIIEYAGGTKGDMLCRFLNSIASDQDSKGKTLPLEWEGGFNWLKLVNPYDLTLERVEDVLSKNPYKFLPAHILWVTYDKNYRDLLKKYNYEIWSIKFEPKHYLTIQIESLLKNLFRADFGPHPPLTSHVANSMLSGWSYRQRVQVPDILNVLVFENKRIPQWLQGNIQDWKEEYSEEEWEELDIWNLLMEREKRVKLLLTKTVNILYRSRACTYRLFNEMTEGRTILNYEDLYLGKYPFPHMPHREKEWNALVNNSWCDYHKRGYRKFDEPVPDYREIEGRNNVYTKIILQYLEQWKK